MEHRYPEAACLAAAAQAALPSVGKHRLFF